MILFYTQNTVIAEKISRETSREKTIAAQLKSTKSPKYREFYSTGVNMLTALKSLSGAKLNRCLFSFAASKHNTQAGHRVSKILSTRLNFVNRIKTKVAWGHNTIADIIRVFIYCRGRLFSRLPPGGWVEAVSLPLSTGPWSITFKLDWTNLQYLEHQQTLTSTKKIIITFKTMHNDFQGSHPKTQTTLFNALAH